MAARANLSGTLATRAATHPDRTAIKLDRGELTYGVLEHGSRHAAGMLAAAGIGSDDRVGLMLPNGAHFVFMYFAVLRLGAVAVPMSPLLEDAEVSFRVRDSGAQMLFGPPERTAKVGAEFVAVDPGTFERTIFRAEAYEGVAAREESDTALILYAPHAAVSEGAELTHGNLVAAARAACEVVGARPGDVTFGGLPLHRRVRPHRRAQRLGARRRVTEAGAALRPGEDARDRGARQREDAARRPGDVRRDAPPPRGRPVKRQRRHGGAGDAGRPRDARRHRRGARGWNAGPWR